MALSGLTGSLVGGWLALAVLALVLGMLYALTAREAACVRQAIAQQAEARAATRVTGAKKLDLPRSADYWWAFAGRFGIILGLGLWQGYQFYILSDYIKLGQDQSRSADRDGGSHPAACTWQLTRR